MKRKPIEWVEEDFDSWGAQIGGSTVGRAFKVHGVWNAELFTSESMGWRDTLEEAKAALEAGFDEWLQEVLDETND